MRTIVEKFISGLSYLAAAGIAALFMDGCTKPDIPASPDPTLTVEITEVQILPAGETVKIPVVTNTQLAAPVCSHDWLTAKMNEDNSILLITAQANETDAARISNVTLTTESGAAQEIVRTVKVTQANVVVDKTFEFSEEVYELGYAEGTAQVSLLANGKWELTQEKIPGWLEISPTSGTGATAISVAYKSNVSINERATQIMFRNTDQGYTAILKLNQVGNPKGISDFSHLGKGYDAKGGYAQDIYSKASVLDCQKLYEANHIADPIPSYYTQEVTISGENREAYMQNYSVSAGLEGHFMPFSASVNANFSSNSLSSKENSFGTFRHLTKKQVIKLHESLYADMLGDFHTKDFDNDVKNLDAEQLVAKYGTHVIMGLSLGGVLEFSMAADVSETEKSIDWGVALKVGYEKMAYGASASTDFQMYEALSSSACRREQRLLCRGGDSQFASSGFGAESTFNEWLASLNDINKWVMVDYEGNKLMQLDKFISDPAKAAEVNNYINAYMTGNTLPDQVSKMKTLELTYEHDVLNYTQQQWNAVKLEGRSIMNWKFTYLFNNKEKVEFQVNNPAYWNDQAGFPVTRPEYTQPKAFKFNERRPQELVISATGLNVPYITLKYDPDSRRWKEASGSSYFKGDEIKIWYVSGDEVGVGDRTENVQLWTVFKLDWK